MYDPHLRRIAYLDINKQVTLAGWVYNAAVKWGHDIRRPPATVTESPN